MRKRNGKIEELFERSLLDGLEQLMKKNQVFSVPEKLYPFSKS